MKSMQKGFTLIELMIVVAIIGILVAVSYPSYRQHVRKTNRTTDAHAALMRAAELQERFYLQNNTYAPNAATLGIPTTTEHGLYNISVVGDASTFTVTATAIAGQVDDANCLTMSLNQAGQKTKTPVNSIGCW